jgi:hypothetical protein
MQEIDAMLQPFALWLGLGLTKAGIVVVTVWLSVVVWRGTTDGNDMD